jgi:signal transduction histidine kinase
LIQAAQNRADARWKFTMTGMAILLAVAAIGATAIGIAQYRLVIYRALQRLVDEKSAQLVRSQRLAGVGLLAAGVAHEINNPTACILANVEHLLVRLRALKTELRPEDENHRQWIRMSEELLGETHFAAARIRDIVAELKRFSEPDQEKRTEVSLNNVVSGALDLMEHEIRYRARIEKDLQADLPALVGQPERLKKLFFNLLENAAQAIDEGDAEHHLIKIKTWCDAGAIFVSISDDGRGIAPEVMPHIFTPFYTTKPVGVGMGIGLSTAQDIAKKHGGEVVVTSRPNAGAQVQVRFPLRVAPSDSAPKGVRRRVLLIDDEPHLLKALQRMLSQRHEVAIALGGQTALDILKEKEFDIIVSDMMMPDVDGVDVFNRLAVLRPGSEKKIVFATGGVFTTRVQEFMAKVPNRSLQKPFTPDDVFALIDEVVG